MKVRIDTDRCSGHALCALAAPTTFDLDEHGYAVVISAGVAPDDEQSVRLAVNGCPEGAIQIED